MTLREVNRVGEGQKNIPKLRFKGYEDAWEQRKLGALVQFVNGRAYKQEELLDVGKYKVVRVGNFNTNEKWYFSDLELETDKYIDNGDLLYLWATSFGPVIWQGEKAIFHYHIWKLKNFESLDKKYLYSFLEWDKNKISQNTNGSTMVHITKNMIEQRDIEYPTKSEQYRIGSLLESIDKLITLHQRKYDALKAMKKTLLSKMFPKNGEDIPEIRFKGFTNAWEQRKLGSDINVTSVKRVHQSDWETEGVPFYRARDIVSEFKGEEISEPIFVSKKTYEEFSRISGKVRADDLLVTGVGTIGVPYLVKSNNPLYFKDGNVIWIQNNKKLDGYFLFYTFITNPIQNFIRESAGTGTVGTLTIETCKRIPVFIPGKREQIAVGEFFQSLDNLITLHQRKLDELKNMKKTLLQQMFV